MRTPLILPTLAAAALVAGCGATAYGDTGSTAALRGPARAESARHAATVKLADTAFKPGTIHVKVGQTVRFVNTDPVTHTVTATKGAKFDSGNLNPGRSFSIKASKRGTIHYVCLIHPGMAGTIKVG